MWVLLRTKKTLRALLVLSDGTIYSGDGFGAEGIRAGELVFNTGMSGYQESLTDPSYAGQVLISTYPMVGNYGINETDFESPKIHVEGFVVRELCEVYSHRNATKGLDEFLREHSIPGISGIDTRALVRKIRSKGVMPCAISVFRGSTPDIRELLEQARKLDYSETDFVKKVGCKKVRVARAEKEKKKIALLDCGVKESIVRNFVARGVSCFVMPPDSSAKEVLSLEPDGIVLSNGPGNPALLGYLIKTARELIGKKPVFGICLGHQIVAHALGGNTFKLKFGHRGANHAVKNLETGKVLVTSQNHGFAPVKETLPEELKVLFVNCSDGTIEGMRHKELPVLTMQFHPEANPGPLDANYLFDEFLEMI